MSVARAAVISVYSTAPRDIFHGQHEQTSALSSNKCIMSLIAESAKQMYMYQGRIKYMHVLETSSTCKVYIYIYASSSLTEFLSKLFTAMLRHGYVPQCLRDCIMQPIPKPGKDPSGSDSYRPIALAPTLSKVFEWCILLEFSSSFTTSPLQFGFKRGLSTDLCIGLLKNIIGRYNVHGSTVYGCFLDVSKAFDRVDHSLLFDKLLKRKLSLPELYWRGTPNRK